MEDLVQGVNRLCLKKKTESERSPTVRQNKRGVSHQGKTKLSLINKQVQRRSFATKSLQDFPKKYPKGVYIHATEDAVFKHLMQRDSFRNSFLSAVLREDILESEQLDQALNPLRSFTALREFITNEQHLLLIKEIERDLKDPIDINGRTNRSTDKMNEFLKNYVPLHSQLMALIPTEERNTQLDLICKTRYGLINVEMQVDPQNFWDIRILDHGCGLFHRQFPKGFKWSELKTDVEIAEKVRKVIGISLFEKPPSVSKHLHKFLPWYRMRPWREDELRRDFALREKEDPMNLRCGLEFIDINLEALSFRSVASVLGNESEAYREWLELLAHGHLKSAEEVEQTVSSPVIKEAYHAVRTLPEDVMMRYEEAYIKRQHISHYVASQKEEGIREGIEKGKMEGREEGRKEERINFAKRLLKRKNITLEEISALTDLTEEEIKKLKE